MNDYLKKKEIEINEAVAKFILAFLILCPFLIIANAAGIMELTIKQMAEICGIIICLSVAPVIVVHYSYSEMLNRCVCLTCMQLLVCLLALNQLLEMHIMFILVPLVSLLYMQTGIFFHTARNCFGTLVAIKLVLLYEAYADSVSRKEAIRIDYLDVVVLFIEYLLIMGVLYMICVALREMIASGYRIEQRTDGSFTSTAKVIAEREKEVLQVYNVKGLFLDIKQTMESMIRGKDKTFSLKVDYDLPVSLKGDRDNIRLAMINLLSDFLQFTQNGNVYLEVSFEKGIVPKRGESLTMLCRITCSENLAEDLRYGNALGFALAKNMIQKMNGILLNKTQGTGNTCYTVSFRQLVEDDETIYDLKKKQRMEQEELLSDSRKNAQDMLLASAVTALVVDDSRTNQKLIEAILHSYRIRAVCVSSGAEALEKVREKIYDFVILDHMMPVKGGIQVAKEIRQLGEPYYELLPLLAMTSNVTEESRKMFRENGFADVISKPIQKEELRQALANCMFL